MKNPLALMQVRAIFSGLDRLRLVEPTSKGWHSLREEKNMEQYFEKAQELRDAMRKYSAEAMRTGIPVPEDFYVKQNELLKVIRNYRAYCKRHNLEYVNI